MFGGCMSGRCECECGCADPVEDGETVCRWCLERDPEPRGPEPLTLEGLRARADTQAGGRSGR